MKQSLLEHFHSKQESIEDRIDKGKALRKKIPRLLHADYKPSSDRRDPGSSSQ